MSADDKQVIIPDGRFTGVDALRAVATFLVVALHVGMPYLPEMMPGLAWPVAGISAQDHNPAVTWLVWSIECFIMPLFFVVSGVSTRVMLDRKGVKPLLLNRRDRLLKPFLMLAVPILIAEFCIWNLGYVLRGELTWDQYFHFDAKDYDPRLWGIAHFWYLQYLLLYTMLLAISCRLRGSSQPATERWFAWGGRQQFLAVLAVCFVWAVGFLSYDPGIVADFVHRSLPIPQRLCYFGIYFIAGVSLVNSVKKSPRAALRTAKVLLVTATLALFVVVGQIRGFLNGSPAPLEQFRAVFLAIVAIGYSVGLTTLVLTRSRPLSPVMIYLSASAYWVYFIHHILCGSMHLTLDRLNWPVGLKFAIVFAAVTSLSLLSYQFLIRDRWADVVLNGRKSTPVVPLDAEQPAETEPSPARRAA